MTDYTYVGGRSWIITRPEGSQQTAGNYGTYWGGADSAHGTTGSDDKWLWALNFTNPRKNNIQRIYAIGGGRSFVGAVPGKYEISGTLEYDVQNANHMKYVLGAIDNGSTTLNDLDGTTLSDTTATYKVYKVSESGTVDSFSIEQIMLTDADAGVTQDIDIRYTGCKVNQMTLRADTENPLKVTLDWIGQNEAIMGVTASTPSPTAYTDIPPMFYKGTIQFGGTVDHTTQPGKITSGTAIGEVNSVEATLTNNLEPYWSISTTRGTKFLIEKQREYSLTLDLNFTNLDSLRRFYDGATSATGPLAATLYTPFTVTLDYKTGVTTSLDNVYRQLRFIFENVYFDEASFPINPTDIIKYDVKAFAKNLTVYNITTEAL